MKNKIIFAVIIIVAITGGFFGFNRLHNASRNVSKVVNLPKNINNLDGTIREINGGELSVEKSTIEHLGHNRCASGGKGEMLKVKVQKNTQYTLRVTYDQGKTHTDKAGNKSELKVGRVITIFGESDGTAITAKNIRILQVNQRN
ncbi:hypothetical protein ACJDT4_22645 [Clostridium neuense]|uniref:DUF5666 domain-containing protein n=1 Tax=Clostridium neuense TaxID=1728934 RepID=A0ABW8TL26_9CLOT